jgi:hypothetical protein
LPTIDLFGTALLQLHIELIFKPVPDLASHEVNEFAWADAFALGDLLPPPVGVADTDVKRFFQKTNDLGHRSFAMVQLAG